MSGRPPGTRRRHEVYYDLVALGMWAYTRLRFRVVVLGAGRFRWQRGLVLVVTHRAETDVPLLAPPIYRRSGFLRERRGRLHFVAREDVFERGFLAGFPERMPTALRRVLWPLRVGPVVARMRMHPVPHPSADLIRLGRALEQLPPSLSLADVLPPGPLGELERRADAARLPRPATVADVLRGAYADLLWRPVGRETLAAPAFEPVWERRRAASLAAVRGLVELMRSGESVLFFPEGRPSPDGAVGPLRDGFARLLSRGRPDAVQPIGIAYDPMTRGRTRAYLAFANRLDARSLGSDDDLLDALRRAMPLTCGQVVANELHEADEPDLEQATLDAALEGAVERAVACGRPVAPALLVAEGRARHVRDAVSWLVSEGVARRAAANRVAIDLGAARSHPLIVRLAVEYRSAADHLGPSGTNSASSPRSRNHSTIAS